MKLSLEFVAITQEIDLRFVNALSEAQSQLIEISIYQRSILRGFFL